MLCWPLCTIATSFTNIFHLQQQQLLVRPCSTSDVIEPSFSKHLISLNCCNERPTNHSGLGPLQHQQLMIYSSQKCYRNFPFLLKAFLSFSSGWWWCVGKRCFHMSDGILARSSGQSCMCLLPCLPLDLSESGHGNGMQRTRPHLLRLLLSTLLLPPTRPQS